MEKNKEFVQMQNKATKQKNRDWPSTETKRRRVYHTQVGSACAYCLLTCTRMILRHITLPKNITHFFPGQVTRVPQFLRWVQTFMSRTPLITFDTSNREPLQRLMKCNSSSQLWYKRSAGRSARHLLRGRCVILGRFKVSCMTYFNDVSHFKDVI